MVGDIFGAPTQTIVNTVSTRGVMGKGLALAFKERFPAMFRDCRERCARGEIRVGQPYLYTASQPWILNFPTKDHRRSPSRLVWIRDGLEHFAQHYREWGVTSIAFPQLGTQHGKLAWEQVRPVMHEVLDPLELNVLVYTLDSPTDDIIPDDRLPETQPRLLWGRMARHTPTRGTLPRGRRLACRRRSQR